MSASDFLRLQLSLLISQFGREKVVDVLAGLSEISSEQLEAEIPAHDARKRTKVPKHEKSLEEIVGVLVVNSEDAKRTIAQIGRLYEAKQFLPNLRDAEEFLRRSGKPDKNFKSRRAAFEAVLKAVSEMPAGEVQSLLVQLTSSHGQSDYALLANQLMGKGR